MTRAVPVLIAAAWLTASAQSQRPEFKVTPEVPAMPKALMKLPRTPITRAKFPAVDFHFHGGQLRTAEDYTKIVKQMDEIGVGVLCNMDGGFGTGFDRAMTVGGPFKDRVLQFARLDFTGINEPGWSAKTAAELERDFLAGAAGLKINKVLGLDLRNADGTYIQADDKRFDPIWEMAAKHNKPVMIHISDSYGRFLPIGPENERYEAGLWRSSPEGNYYKTGQPTPDVIEKARENMHAKHPKTRFVNAHVAMLYYDMDKVAALLDRFPNADVEISATVQDLGRAPRLTREFFLKYQDRILFGKDAWQPEEFPYYWRVFETRDEYFDYYRDYHAFWKLYGMDLPDDVLKKLYYKNAIRVAKGMPSTGWPQ
jgi:uncharacterized protein